MAKRKDSSYQPGLRTGDWMKIKQLQSCDCVVFAIRGERGSERRLSELLIWAFTIRKRLFSLGKVGTGFTEKTLETLNGEIQRATINRHCLKLD